MNILIVTQYFWPESFRINALAEDLVALQHNVSVLTGQPNYPEGRFYEGYGFLRIQKEWYKSIQIIRSPMIRRGKNSRLMLALNYLSFALISAIVGFFRCQRPDIIFVYGPSPITVCLPAIFLKNRMKAPILFWVQDLWPESVVAVNAVRNKWLLNGLEKLVKYIYKNCDYILTTSKAYFDAINPYLFCTDKLRYFPQTAESCYQPIDPQVCVHEDAVLPKGFRILFSGNLGIAQDLETILDAAALLREDKEMKWIFMGDGSKRKWLQQAIIDRGLTDSVHWIGSYPAESMPGFFAVSDVLLITLKPEKIFSLTIPAKLQSYLACAKPIIAALQGEGKRIIEEAKAGWVAKSGDANALALLAAKMKSLPIDTRKNMGLNGLQYFQQHFDRRRLLNHLEQWMRELMESRAA